MGRNNQLKASVLTWLEEMESMAISTLADVGITPADVVDMSVAVCEHDLGVVGSLPKILLDCLNQPFNGIQEVKISNLDTPLMKAFVARDIIAYCQYSKYGSNPAIETSEDILQQVSEDWLRSPSPWVMIKLANAINNSVNIMNDPERLAEHVLHACQINGMKADHTPDEWSIDLNSIIKDILDNMPKKSGINRIDEYVFSSLVGKRKGVITEISSNSENNGRVDVWYQSEQSNDEQGSPLFGMLSQPAQHEDSKKTLTLGAIKKRISKVNSQKTQPS